MKYSYDGVVRADKSKTRYSSVMGSHGTEFPPLAAACGVRGVTSGQRALPSPVLCTRTRQTFHRPYVSGSRTLRPAAAAAGRSPPFKKTQCGCVDVAVHCWHVLQGSVRL